jgi:hypothetical protein
MSRAMHVVARLTLRNEPALQRLSERSRSMMLPGQDRDDQETMTIDLVGKAKSRAAMCGDRPPFAPDS